MAVSIQILVMVSLICCFLSSATPANKELGVTYDGKSLIINGKHELLFSGSIHYPRSLPQMWPDLLDKAKRGGLDVIQTYVFWNIHEREKDKFTVEERYDLVKFIRLVQEKGMYVTLRLGPFIQGEWNHGGLPYWLREIPDIIFRSDNEPFKKEMVQFVTMVINKMKEEKLFAPQGGPIILAQIENEYNQVQLAYRHKGDSYVQWAANLAVSFNVGVPWVMCKQRDAPDPVINACNGRHCADTFPGPNKPYKPHIWTENWTVQYKSFGDPPSERSAEDITMAVARFFSKDGALVNYYMYHGGTNFNRTSAGFSTTRYYDEAPLDEYGLEREPKYGHMRDCHKAISMCKKALLSGKTSVQKINEFHEIRFYEKAGTEICAAFFANNHTEDIAKIAFRGQTYELPPFSISILPDCKTVVFNSAQVVSQHNARNFKKPKTPNNFKWEMYSEPIPTTKELPVSNKFPKELYTLLKDTTDYGWFTTSIELGPEDLPLKKGTQPVLRVISLGHAIIVYANGEYVGRKHGAHEDKVCEVSEKVNLKVGLNHISVLGLTVGLPDSGAYMEHRYAGPKAVTILSLNTGTLDLTVNGWGHQAGLKGELNKIFTEEGSKKVNWVPFNGVGPALTWYKTTFLTPEGDGPCVIRMTGMGKGMVWVNGENIGRYWMSFLSPLGTPSQEEYHIPRGFLRPKENFLVILEEEPKGPKEVEILNVDRDTICTYISEKHPPSVDSWQMKSAKLTPIGTPTTKGTLICPALKKIVAVEFASYGDPVGVCGDYDHGKCNINAPNVKQIAEQECMGKPTCSISVDKNLYLKGTPDPCPNIVKKLAVQVLCA